VGVLLYHVNCFLYLYILGTLSESEGEAWGFWKWNLKDAKPTNFPLLNSFFSRVRQWCTLFL
jgi:hypothetical protein